MYLVFQKCIFVQVSVKCTSSGNAVSHPTQRMPYCLQKCAKMWWLLEKCANLTKTYLTENIHDLSIPWLKRHSVITYVNKFSKVLSNTLKWKSKTYIKKHL